MSETSTERLRDYLTELPPQSQALLMREFERAIERGEDVAVAHFVLGQLRQIVRGSELEVGPRSDDPARLLFRPLQPFLTETHQPARPGQIRRVSLAPIWQWLERDGIADQIREFQIALVESRAQATTASEIDPAVRRMQLAVAEAITLVTSQPVGDGRRALARIGDPAVVADLQSIATVLQHRDTLDAFNGRLPGTLRAFTDPQVASVLAGLNGPMLQTPRLLPFALSLLMQRLAAPWQIIRLAIKVGGSDDELRVAATPYGVAVTMAIGDLADVAARLGSDIKRGHLIDVPGHLKTVHDGIRGLRTELDIRNDSPWGRQIAAIRVEISGSLRAEIENVPGRVRRLLRQRADKDITTATRLGFSEVEEVAARIDFVAVCRSYAGELAINEVTSRTFSDLQQYVETSTETLVQSLRGGDPRVRDFRRMQVKAAVRFCEVLFGHDYAALMSRAADNAAVESERQPSRAS